MTRSCPTATTRRTTSWMPAPRTKGRSLREPPSPQRSLRSPVRPQCRPGLSQGLWCDGEDQPGVPPPSEMAWKVKANDRPYHHLPEFQKKVFLCFKKSRYSVSSALRFWSCREVPVGL